MVAIATTDHWIAHPDGAILARQWRGDAAAPAAAPLVLMHDSLGCIELWRDLPARLAEATKRTVIAYDRLGFGRSDARDARPSQGFVAEEATAVFPLVREQLGIGRFAIAGHSVGGGMSLEIAAHAAADCEAVVTIAAQALVEERTLMGLYAAKEDFDDPEQVERLARYHGEKAAWVLDAWLGTWLDLGFRGWSLADVLPRVTCPVLAIHGAADEYGTAAHPKRICAGVSGPARLELLPGVGHFPHREQPDHVVALVAAFLAGVG